MPERAPAQLPPGVRLLDHTADVGIEVEAPDLVALFVRSALAADALVGGAPEPRAAATETATLELEELDVALLLASWLRELLYLRQVRQSAFVRAAFDRLTETRLAGRIELAPPAGDAIREIKGVTYHGLEAARAGDVWRARVIFDV